MRLSATGLSEQKESTVMDSFVYVPGIGVYRKDLIKKIEPFHKIDYSISVEPPKEHTDEFEVKLTKSTEIIPAIHIEDEEEPVLDEESSLSVNAYISFTLEEIFEELYPLNAKGKQTTEDKDTLSSLSKKAKNYKLRLKKLSEHEEKLTALEAAKGSPSYDDLVQALNDSAPTTEGQDKGVEEISNTLDQRFKDLMEQENTPSFVEMFESDDDAQVKQAAHEVLLNFLFKLENGLSSDISINEEPEENENEGDDIDEEDIEGRLIRISPDDAIKNATNILASDETLTNKEDYEEGDYVDNGEEEEPDSEDESEEIKPANILKRPISF